MMRWPLVAVSVTVAFVVMLEISQERAGVQITTAQLPPAMR
ncbi:hypothetical protein [Mesorhizobium sp. SP-1A]|nr:hypothetical protein [Mesorhizobium sp. SP-1A]